MKKLARRQSEDGQPKVEKGAKKGGSKVSGGKPVTPRKEEELSGENN